jgi:hypothetical protein
MGTESNRELNLKTDRSHVLSKINLREIRKGEKVRKEGIPYYTSFLPSASLLLRLGWENDPVLENASSDRITERSNCPDLYPVPPQFTGSSNELYFSPPTSSSPLTPFSFSTQTL